jgi:hypothetical protein
MYSDGGTLNQRWKNNGRSRAERMSPVRWSDGAPAVQVEGMEELE